MTLENEIYISDKNERIEKVLIFKEGKIICIKTEYNIYFYSFDLKNIFRSTSSESNQIINLKIKKIENHVDPSKKYIEMIVKKDENKFFLCGYDSKYYYDSENDAIIYDDDYDNDDSSNSNSNNINAGDNIDTDNNINDDDNADDKSNSYSFDQEDKSKSWITIYNIIN